MLIIFIVSFYSRFAQVAEGGISAAYQLGDVNGDGQVNIADALLIARYDAGLITQFTDSGGQVIALRKADVTGTPKGEKPKDTGVNIIDALLVAQFDVKIISNFPSATIRSLPSAFPTTGNSPLAVTFTEKGEDPESTIEYYRWDFDGDGAYDHNWDPVAIIHHYTYNKSGTYQAVLQVKNSAGETATSAVTIMVYNSPPQAIVSADPSNGPVPLTVNLSGSGSFDPDGSIVLYEWDFNGNGTYEYSSPTSGNTTHTYTTIGTHQAIFQITDNEGAQSISSVVTSAIHVGPWGTPVARASADTTSGYAPLTVNFSDGGSTDDGTIEKFEWDFDGDGEFDYSSTSSSATSHIYNEVGTFTVTYRITDNMKKTSIDQLLITADIQVGLSRSNDTINATKGETTDITSSINTRSPVTITIKDQTGSTIKTLVNQVTRDPGTYIDSWDGRDDTENIVNDSIYYAILEYTINGTTNVYDLTYTTGGTQYNPSRQSVEGADPANPFADIFLPITFTLVKASEVTLFVGVLWASDTRVRTILNRVPMPKGTHIAYWDGLDDQGNIAEPPPGDSLILGVWGYYFPDNAIYVTGGKPVIGNVAAEPNYYSPFSEKCDNQGIGEGVTLTYELSEAVSKVTLRVYRIDDGSLIRSYTENNVLAGANTVFWDGQNNQGEYADIGDYRIGLMATDPEGNESMLKYALITIDY